MGHEDPHENLYRRFLRNLQKSKGCFDFFLTIFEHPHSNVGKQSKQFTHLDESILIQIDKSSTRRPKKEVGGTNHASRRISRAVEGQAGLEDFEESKLIRSVN